MSEKTCPACGISFPGAWTLSQHLANVHGIKQGGALVICTECGLTYAHYDLLCQHTREAHGIASPPLTSSFSTGGLGSVIKSTFITYGKRFLRLMAIAGIGQVLLFAITAGIGSLILGNPFALIEQSYSELSSELVHPETLSWWTLAVILILVIVSYLVCILLAGAIVYAVAEHHVGRPPGILRAYAFALKRLRAMVSAVLLIFLTLVTIPVIMWFVLFFLSAIVRFPAIVPLIILGLTELILFVIVIRWSFVLQLALLEKAGAKESLGYSWSLVSGNWWRVFGILLLFAIITFLIALVFNITLDRIPFVGIIFTYILLTPLALIAQTLLYFHLRARNEGSGSVIADVAGQIGIRSG